MGRYTIGYTYSFYCLLLPAETLCRTDRTGYITYPHTNLEGRCCFLLSERLGLVRFRDIEIRCTVLNASLTRNDNIVASTLWLADKEVHLTRPPLEESQGLYTEVSYRSKISPCHDLFINQDHSANKMSFIGIIWTSKKVLLWILILSVFISCWTKMNTVGASGYHGYSTTWGKQRHGVLSKYLGK